MGISKIGIMILVDFAAAIRLEVRWRHGGRKAASVRKVVWCFLRFGRRNFGGSKAVGMPITYLISKAMEKSRAALTTATTYPNTATSLGRKGLNESSKPNRLFI